MFKTKSKNHQFKNLKNSNLGFASIFGFRSSILTTSSISNTKGAIGILTTLVLSAVLVLMAVGVVLNGISARANAFNLNQSTNVFIPVEGCAEEALVQVSRNSSYSGDSFTLDNVNCTVSVSGSGDTRDLIVSGEKNNVTRDLLLRVQVTPAFGIIEWSD